MQKKTTLNYLEKEQPTNLTKRPSKPAMRPAPPPEDSSPTPVFELGWRELSARLRLLGSRLSSQALVFAKHPLKIDMTKSRRCTDLANETQRMADRVEQWPNLSSAGLSGEKNFVSTRYLDIMTEAVDMLGPEVI